MVLDESTWNELSGYRGCLEHYGVRKARETSGSKRSAEKKEQVKKRMSLLQRRKSERVKKVQEAGKKKKETAAKKAEKRRESILRSPTKLYKHRREFSQDEINNALKNFEWGAELNSYSQKELNRGREYIDTAFKYANSSINLYDAAARVVNGFDLSDKPWKYIPNVKGDDKDKRKSTTKGGPD